ncbi:Acyl-CoA dehydrogenase [Roseomonas rosea]|uniref:Acyl-CoA dehydrogenase n=1 Tax=Muricoccus roseus TaxID=198092 RepID=A0A1M6T1H3_9PROT|nr:acyl-CoA dehydrogenase family protein [Roseomonas rosea]SHK50776.1 Acyl-CoA dehydrogenase [Roseomonas rosea]
MPICGTYGSEAARLIQAAADLSPGIIEMRNQIERDRRLPMPLVERLRELGFFSLWLARGFGGPELSLTDFVQVVEALARSDASVAWCVTNGGGYARFSGFLPEAVARRIFVEERAVVAGNMGPLGKAVSVPGGYSVTGRWPYGSGIMHSNWVLGGCVVLDGDTPRRRPDGAPDAKIVFFPTAAAEVIDTWEVGGLRGTGSHDYRVADLFVPDSHTVSRTGHSPLLPDPLYALPFHTAFGVTIAAVPLGIARAALDSLRELGAAKTPRTGSALLRDRPVIQAAVGRAEASLRAARAFLLEACDQAWSATSAGTSLSLEQRALVRLACAQVAETAKVVVQTTYDAGGGTSVYENCLLQRCFRDAHAAAQHIQIQSGNFETGGRVMLGLEPGTPIL